MLAVTDTKDDLSPGVADFEKEHQGRRREDFRGQRSFADEGIGLTGQQDNHP